MSRIHHRPHPLNNISQKPLFVTTEAVKGKLGWVIWKWLSGRNFIQICVTGSGSAREQWGISIKMHQKDEDGKCLRVERSEEKCFPSGDKLESLRRSSLNSDVSTMF